MVSWICPQDLNESKIQRFLFYSLSPLGSCHIGMDRGYYTSGIYSVRENPVESIFAKLSDKFEKGNWKR